MGGFCSGFFPGGFFPGDFVWGAFVTSLIFRKMTKFWENLSILSDAK